MKKMLIISASILGLALLLAATQIPAEQVIADTASVSKDADFQLNGTTLVKYTGTAKTVSVLASVTSIAAEAFVGNTSMEVLKFKGDKVEEIAYRAFAECTNLEEVKLPDSVTELGNGAFSNCTSLETVTFGENLAKLGIGVFAGCEELERIKVDKDNDNFMTDDACLYNADKTKLILMLPEREKNTYSMPSTVTDIAEYAFWGCDNLESITLSSNLQRIPDYSFFNCQSLESVVIPYSVKTIDVKAFSDCVSLESVTIPSTVTYIHDTAFNGCKRLNMIADAGTVAYEYYQDWKEANKDLPAEKEEEEDADKDDTEDKETIVSPSVVPGDIIGTTYVVDNSAVVFIDNTNQRVEGDSSAGLPDDAGIADGSADSFESLVSSIPKATVAFDKILADQAYYGNKNMADYKMPAAITEIGEFTFARSNLVEADIPNGVKTIGYGAFYHCDYLREVDIPFSVTYIAPKAFAETMWLKNWLAGEGEDYLVVGDGILLAYRGDGGNIILPDSVRRIAPEVFAGNKDIVSVVIPDSVIDIGEAAFYGCKNLKTVTGGENVDIIRDRAFMGCALETAHVWESVTRLGLNSFHFADTTLSTSNKVVVFDNKNALPEVSSEESAGRLSDEEARGYLLGDTAVVIVDKSIKARELVDTILMDANCFKGIVACITSKEQGIVTCLATTYSEEELADAYIPEYITIDGKSYHVVGVEDITLFGETEQYDTGSITITNESTSLTVMSAELTNNDGAYTLQVSDEGTGILPQVTMNKAYEWVYDEELPKTALCVDMTLTDRLTGVSITKLSNETLTVTMTLPKGFTAGSLKLFTVDRNGQLESLPFTGNGNIITFRTNHLSPIAFVR